MHTAHMCHCTYTQHSCGITRVHSTYRAHLEKCSAPRSWEGQHPCSMFLSYTGCLCFSIFAIRLWDCGTLGSVGSRAAQGSLFPILWLRSRWHQPVLSCPPVMSFNHSAS